MVDIRGRAKDTTWGSILPAGQCPVLVITQSVHMVCTPVLLNANSFSWCIVLEFREPTPPIKQFGVSIECWEIFLLLTETFLWQGHLPSCKRLCAGSQWFGDTITCGVLVRTFRGWLGHLGLDYTFTWDHFWGRLKLRHYSCLSSNIASTLGVARWRNWTAEETLSFLWEWLQVEADSFWCLIALLDGIQDHYIFAQKSLCVILMVHPQSHLLW
jgi:hypothetical protein